MEGEPQHLKPRHLELRWRQHLVPIRMQRLGSPSGTTSASFCPQFCLHPTATAPA
jgi:hypothetical protein